MQFHPQERRRIKFPVRLVDYDPDRSDSWSDLTRPTHDTVVLREERLKATFVLSVLIRSVSRDADPVVLCEIQTIPGLRSPAAERKRKDLEERLISNLERAFEKVPPEAGNVVRLFARPRPSGSNLADRAIVDAEFDFGRGRREQERLAKLYEGAIEQTPAFFLPLYELWWRNARTEQKRQWYRDFQKGRELFAANGNKSDFSVKSPAELMLESDLNGVRAAFVNPLERLMQSFFALEFVNNGARGEEIAQRGKVIGPETRFD